MKIKKYSIATIICLLSGIAFFIYVFLRAWNISITHDEAFSYNNVVLHSFMEIISYNTSPGPAIPNNHILNSLFMKFFAWVFGPSAFVLRLPNVLAYLVYLFFAFQICKRFKNQLLIISGFLLLNCNPYLLEFFGMARGYGLSIALMMGAIFFLLEWKDKCEQRKLHIAFLMVTFSVVANFSLLHFYLGFYMVVNLLIFTTQPKEIIGFANRTKYLLQKNIIPGLITILLFALLYEPLRKIIKWHETFGGVTGFWNDTVRGEIGAFGGNQNYRLWLIPLLEIGIIIFSLLILSGVLKTILKRNFSSNVFASGLLLFFPIVIHILEHFLFGTEFLVARTGLYFAPLFVVAFLFAVNYWAEKSSSIFVGVLAMFGVFHLYLNENIRFNSEWKYDCDNRQALEFINSTFPKNSFEQTQIGITWLLEPGMNFYINTQYASNRFANVTRESVEKKEFDIYYVLASDTTYLKNKGKQILKRFPESDTYVMR